MEPNLLMNKKRKFGNDMKNKENIPKTKEKENKINDAENNNQNGKENCVEVKECNESMISMKKNRKDVLKKKESKSRISPQYAPDYISDIIRNIIENESLNILNYSEENIFRFQNNEYINEKNRNNIIELFFYYNNKWNLNPDSVYLTVNILDRYTNIIKIKNGEEYQLVAAAAFLIGSKYEDIYCLNAKCLSYIFSFKFTPEQILEKEYHILSTLDFSLLYHSSYKILRLMSTLSGIKNNTIYYFAELLLELSLTDFNIMEYSQRKRAMAACIFAKKIFGINSGNYEIQFLFGYNEKEIKILQHKLFNMLKDVAFSERNNLIAEKFRAEKYSSIFTVFELKLKDRINERRNISNSDEPKKHMKRKSF